MVDAVGVTGARAQDSERDVAVGQIKRLVLAVVANLLHAEGAFVKLGDLLLIVGAYGDMANLVHGLPHRTLRWKSGVDRTIAWQQASARLPTMSRPLGQGRFIRASIDALMVACRL